MEKLRNLLNDPRGEDLCLDTIITETLKLEKNCAKLEMENNKQALTALKREIRKVKELMINFEYRVKVKIGHEIISNNINKNKNR